MASFLLNDSSDAAFDLFRIAAPPAMHLIRNLSTPELSSPDNVPRTEPRLLLVGEDFAWLPRGATLADRTVFQVATKEEALHRLASEPFEGLVAGLRETGKNIALLNAASAAHPTLACGLQADLHGLGKLSLPYTVMAPTESLPVMDDQVRTMFATAFWTANPAFAELRKHIVVYPALPSLYLQITAALRNDNVSLETLAELIAREPTVSARLLQISNSPVFSRAQRITSIRDAVSLIGLLRVRALVLATSLFGQCDASKCAAFSTSIFESRSLQVATWAAQIAMGETNDAALAEMAFTAGLLHRFGVLLLAANLPESYNQVLRLAAEQKISVARVERETYGATHAELAGYIFASWGIPFPILNAVGYYAMPSHAEDRTFTPLSAVHIATALDSYSLIGVRDYDYDYLARLKLLPRLDFWSQRLVGKPWEQEN